MFPPWSAALSRRRQVLACVVRGSELRRVRVYSGTRVNCDGHAIPLANGTGHVRFPVGAHAVDKGEGAAGDEGAVGGAGDGQDALDHLAVTSYDVVVLDRGIPGAHGDDVCKALVANGSPSRVLMLTAAGSVGDRVEGLGIGADDYLVKPCDFTELVARIRGRPPHLQAGIEPRRQRRPLQHHRRTCRGQAHIHRHGNDAHRYQHRIPRTARPGEPAA